MNILVQGSSPSGCSRRIDDLHYPAGDVELLDEEPDDPARQPRPASRARERYADLVERVTDSRPERGRPRRARRLRHGGHARLRARRQAGAAGAALRGRAAQRLAGLCVEALERLDYAAQGGAARSGNGKVRGKDG